MNAAFLPPPSYGFSLGSTRGACLAGIGIWQVDTASSLLVPCLGPSLALALSLSLALAFSLALASLALSLSLSLSLSLALVVALAAASGFSVWPNVVAVVVVALAVCRICVCKRFSKIARDSGPESPKRKLAFNGQHICIHDANNLGRLSRRRGSLVVFLQEESRNATRLHCELRIHLDYRVGADT